MCHNINHGAELPVHRLDKQPLKPGAIQEEKHFRQLSSQCIQKLWTESTPPQKSKPAGNNPPNFHKLTGFNFIKAPNFQWSIYTPFPLCKGRWGGSIPEPVQEGRITAVFPHRLTELHQRGVGLAARRRPPSGAAGTFSWKSQTTKEKTLWLV